MLRPDAVVHKCARVWMLVVKMIGKCSAHLVRSDLEGEVLSLDPDDGMVHPG
jgi:hypothetical protein